MRPTPGKDVVQRTADDALWTIRLGGGGARTRVVCGFLGAENLRQNLVVSSLPPAVCLDLRRSGAVDWVQSTFQYAAVELARGRLGSETVLAKLSELLFVEAVRSYAESLPPEQTGWLAGLRDPYVGRALALLHGNPKEEWTVQRLGREVGLSRSAFADRFLHVMGMSPMQYLATWRMQLARQELLHSHKSLAEIADLVGYESEAAFSRAFKRLVGKPPGTFRRERA